MNSMKRQKDMTLKDELPRSVGAQYATREEWRNNSRKNEGKEPKQKQLPGVDVTGDGSKVQCCKEQYCIRTWNVIRAMNQGKLEVVKHEMARVNTDMLGISELNWTRMGEFNSDDHYIYYHGQESLRRNGVAITVNKIFWNAVLGCKLKNNRMISVCFQGKSFNNTVIQVYALTTNPEEAEVEQFYEDLQDLLELTPKKDVLFIRGDWNPKVGSQEIIWSNRQVWPQSTKWIRVKANRVLPRDHTGHSKHPLPTAQEKTLHMDITDGQYWNKIDYILCSQKWRISIQSAKTRLGVDCDSDHELLTAKFRLKLKKVGQTTRPYRYDLYQIPYDWLYSGSDK